MARKVQYVFNAKGEKTSVLLPVGEYERVIEDLGDLRAIEERRGSKLSTLKQVKERRLKKVG